MARVVKEVRVDIGSIPLQRYRRTGTLTLTNIPGFPRLTLLFQADPKLAQDHGRSRTLGDGTLRYIANCKGYVNKRFVGDFILIQSPTTTVLQILG